jgi:hypothetical protein
VKTNDRGRVAVVGASGYAGEELVRLLLSHRSVELTAITSRHHVGNKLSEVFPRFARVPSAGRFPSAIPIRGASARNAEIVFLAASRSFSRIRGTAARLKSAGGIEAHKANRDHERGRKWHRHLACESTNTARMAVPQTRLVSSAGNSWNSRVTFPSPPTSFPSKQTARGGT